MDHHDSYELFYGLDGGVKPNLRELIGCTT